MEYLNFLDLGVLTC